MKILVNVCLLLLVTLNATAELTKNDIQEIEKLLDKHDEQMKQYIDLKIDAVNARIDKVEGTLSARIDKVESTLNARIDKVKEKVDSLMWFIVLLVAIIVGAVALPQAFQLWRERKESRRFDIIENQIERIQQAVHEVTARSQFDVITKELAVLKQEIVSLKEEKFHLVRP